ncbi:DUF362 domain-containing protein [Zavarzinella formosa]|uniref:DUF362 domain-containing protein n=1 Tax=Zavarzinella formosa TaxID=360055 RepID=UPI0003072D23|nr:DUF362 domain-containing protein [Zavarzinella formosa]
MKPLDALVSLVRADGGWGYQRDQEIQLEPTCMALMALAGHQAAYADLIARSRAALETQSDGKGLYRLLRGRPEAFWPTALSLAARAALGEPKANREASIRRLLEVRGRTIIGDPEVDKIVDIDTTKVGWPWADGTFAWAEPTAWAVLALRLNGEGDHPRVIEGVKLLLDRCFEDGGINYGSRRMLGIITEPIPGPTAIFLLALQGSDDPRVAAARQYLMRVVEPMTDLEHLGWAKLALAAHDHDPAVREFLPKLDAQIQRAYDTQTAEGRPVSVLRHALVELALHTSERHPLRLTGENARPVPATGETVPPAKPQAPPKPGFVEGIKSKVRNFMIRGLGAMRQPPEFGSIHIGKAPEYEGDLLAVLKGQYEHYRPHLPFAGKRIVLKPNLVEFRKAQVINTDPRFIDAVIQLCKAEGAAEVIVAEGPGHWRNVEFLVEESGLGRVLRKHDVKFVDLNHDEPVKVPNLGRTTGLDYLYMPRTVMSADVFISLPKMKTHHWAGATLSLKNLFGIMPGICYGWPKNELHWRGIPNSIIDIALTQTPHMAIVDGIVGMEGDGPLSGDARHSGVMVMGLDLVAVDATCCRLMKLPAGRIPTLVLGNLMKLGRLAEADIPQIGETIASMAQDYVWPPKMETILMPEKPAV